MPAQTPTGHPANALPGQTAQHPKPGPGQTPTGHPANALPGQTAQHPKGGPGQTPSGHPANALPGQTAQHPKGGSVQPQDASKQHVVLKPKDQKQPIPVGRHNLPGQIDPKAGSSKTPLLADAKRPLSHRPTLGHVPAAKVANGLNVKPAKGGTSVNRLNAIVTNPSPALSLTGGQTGRDSANVLKGQMVGKLDTPANASPIVKSDLETLRQAVQNGASADEVRADVDRLKQDMAAQASAGKPVVGGDALIQKADQLATLSSISDQLAQGPPPQDLPLPTGETTFISNPMLPQGQMVVLGPDTVLLGGGYVPPTTATMLPYNGFEGGGGGNVAVWTGTMSGMGIPVQAGYPLTDVEPLIMPTSLTVAANTAFIPQQPGLGLLPARTQPLLGQPQFAQAPSVRVVMVNTPDSGGTITYVVGAERYTLEPGYEQEHELDTPPIIEFDRGGSFGLARYTLQPVRYAFVVGGRGWDIQPRDYEATLDNRDNSNDFHFMRGTEPDVVPARQIRLIRYTSPIRVSFDRGDGAEPALKELGDGSYKIGVDARTGLFDLFPGNDGGQSENVEVPQDAADEPPPPPPPTPSARVSNNRS